MTLVAFPGGMLWPWVRNLGSTNSTSATMDAATEKAAHIGRLYIAGRPAGTKTLDTSGSSKIGFLCGTPITFANGTTSIDIGIQGVNTSGPVAQPDGSFSVKSVVTTVANTTPGIAANTWCEAVPTTGTVSLSHGDLISVVWDMTARGGADSVLIATNVAQTGATDIFPTTNAFASSAWGAAGVGVSPNVVITFSDGTLGFIDGSAGVGLSANVTWTDATNPDEQGMIFQVPFDCKVDALTTIMRTVDGTSDFIISLYEAAETAAAVMNAGAATVTVDGAQIGTTAQDRFAVFNLASEVSLSKNTDYCVAIKASGAGNLRMTKMTLGNATHRAFFPGTTNLRNVTRNGGSGNFASSSTTIMFTMGVRISQVDDGTGAGSGGFPVLGGPFT